MLSLAAKHYSKIYIVFWLAAGFFLFLNIICGQNIMSNIFIIVIFIFNVEDNFVEFVFYLFEESGIRFDIED